MANQNRQKLIHLHKSQSGAPQTTDLYFGEIAVNHSEDRPALYIKNSQGVIEFLPATAITSIANAHAAGLIDGLDVSAQTIASNSNGVVSIYPTITETNGEIEISGDAIELSKVATTGKAEDITIDDSGNTFTASTVEEALAELSTKMATSTTIDGSGGTFTTGNGIDDTNKVLSVKTKDDDYVTVDANGVQLDSTQIDTTYDSGTTGNLATVATVNAAIDTLDATGWYQGILPFTGDAAGTYMTFYGIKQENGIIKADHDHDSTVYFENRYTYDPRSNPDGAKIATTTTVEDAIKALDVDPISGTTSKTITSISETDGKISATYSDISISKSQITDLEDLSNTYAAKSYETTVDTLVGSDSGKTVRTIANEELAAQLIPESASASLDTLQEIAAWIQDHPADAAAMNLAIATVSGRVDTLEEASHTHDNKQVLDGISATQVSNWDTAYANQHTHSNMDVLTGITSQKVANWDAASESAHSHSNKALLDTYTQTEANLADAVSKKHEHSNSSVLDGISSEDVTSWDNAAESAHTHSNKSILDDIVATDIEHWDIGYNSAHTHANANVLNGITAEQVTGWDAASANSHSHSNLEVLTGITGEKVTAWDNAAESAHTHENASVLDGITSAKVNNWDAVASGAVVGVLNTSSATSANVTVNENNLLDFSNLSIDCGEY